MGALSRLLPLLEGRQGCFPEDPRAGRLYRSTGPLHLVVTVRVWPLMPWGLAIRVAVLQLEDVWWTAPAAFSVMQLLKWAE